MSQMILKSIALTLSIGTCLGLMSCGNGDSKTEKPSVQNERLEDMGAQYQAGAAMMMECQQGDGDACLTIARNYEKAGIKTEIERKRTAGFYKLACEAGIDEGCVARDRLNTQ